MNTRRVLTDIAGIRTEKLPSYLVMNAGANHAAVITPLSSTLINSQYKKLEPNIVRE